MTAMASYDVIIVGGGIIGSSIAYWLAADSSFDGSVLVIERDSSYADSSTARSNSHLVASTQSLHPTALLKLPKSHQYFSFPCTLPSK